MTQKDIALANDKFYKFLQVNGPQKESDCTLYQGKSGKYYLVVMKLIGNNEKLYLINDHFWYDFTEDFTENGEWKVIYKRVI